MPAMRTRNGQPVPSLPGQTAQLELAASARAAIWIEIEPIVRNVSWRWARHAALRLKECDYDDLIGEIRLRFLRSFNPQTASGQASIYAYVRRCCQSAARQILARKDALSHAESAPHILDVIPDTSSANTINLCERPALGDLPKRLQRRICWFAAHPAKISPQVLAQLRDEIDLNTQRQKPSSVQLPVQLTHGATHVQRKAR